MKKRINYKKNTFKKVMKYTLNGLGIISMIITGVNRVEGITIPYANQIIQLIAVANGVISTYLLGQKAKKEMN